MKELRIFTDITSSLSYLIAPSDAQAKVKDVADAVLPGTADQTAINAAFIISGDVTVAQGTVSLTDEILIPVGASHFRGAGRGLTNIIQNTAGKNLLRAVQVGQPLTMSDFTCKTVEITPTIISQTVSNNPWGLASNYSTRIGERFPGFPVSVIKSIGFKLCKIGNPTGWAYVRVRDLNDNVIGVLGKIDVSTLAPDGGQTFYVFGSGSAFNNAVRDIRICIEYAGGAGPGNYVQVFMQTSNAAPQGYITAYSGNWTDTATEDLCWQNLIFTPGTGHCLYLERLYRSKISNIRVVGAGGYGLYMQGCLLNQIDTFVVSQCDGAEAIGAFVIPEDCIHLSPDFANSIDNNVNTFINPVLEGGGHNGLVQTPSQEPPFGNSQIVGGTMEGFTGAGYLAYHSGGIQLRGTHFEVNGLDIDWDDVKQSHCEPSYAVKSRFMYCARIRRAGVMGTLTDVGNTIMSDDAALI